MRRSQAGAYNSATSSPTDIPLLTPWCPLFQRVSSSIKAISTPRHPYFICPILFRCAGNCPDLEVLTFLFRKPRSGFVEGFLE